MGEKVKVRIALAVDHKGQWNCCGWSGAKDDADMMGIACELLEEGEARYWLVAEVEKPSAEAIEVEAIPYEAVLQGSSDEEG